MIKEFNTPILFLIFNRPDLTLRVFEEIRKLRPKVLYIAADGPRCNIETDTLNCKKTRDVVVNGIDWDCDVKTLFRNQNLGCGIAVSSAITWFFENVEEGIIIEDDCLPNIDFFYYCAELLDKWREDTSVFHISGSNPIVYKKHKVSYFGSKYPLVWGWATWKRAWTYYDYNMKGVNDFLKSPLFPKICIDINEQWFWKKTFSQENNTWDVQWVYALWKNSGKSIIPYKNMIINIGFGEDATHMIINPFKKNNTFNNIFPITHPETIKINKLNDLKYFYGFRFYKSKFKILKNNLKYLIALGYRKLIK